MIVKNVMLIDDEPAARVNMRQVINQFDSLKLVAEIGDGLSAIDAIISEQPDIVFLDIEMPGTDGFEVAKATAHVAYQLVFVTAYDHYALQAFDTRAIDYLLKPVRPSLLTKCIEKMLYQANLAGEAKTSATQMDGSLTVHDGQALRVVQHAHISFVEGIGRYRQIHLNLAGRQVHKMQSVITDMTLDSLVQQLPPNMFMRLHRSFIVNLTFVVSMSSKARRYSVSLQEQDKLIPVARSQVAEIKQYLRHKGPARTAETGF